MSNNNDFRRAYNYNSIIILVLRLFLVAPIWTSVCHDIDKGQKFASVQNFLGNFCQNFTV